MQQIELTDIPFSVVNIGNSAFWGCSRLTSITIGSNLTYLGTSAFSNCENLKTVIWNAKNCADIPCPSYGSVSPFGGSITSFIFGNEVKHIPAHLCSGLSDLKMVSVPNSVTSIGDYAFYSCFKLDSVSLGNSLTTIGEAAFGHCASSTSILIPNSVTTIGDYAFNNVPNIVFSGIVAGSSWGAKSINGYVDAPLVYNDETKTSLRACSAIASGEIIIPNSVTSIEERAFCFCSNLTSVIIPNSVTYIGNYAFAQCSALTSVYCYASTPPSLEVFSDDFLDHVCQNATLYVPQNSIDLYRNTNGWSEFRNIEPIPGESVGTRIECFEHPIAPTKSLRDGKIYILRGEKVYTVTGQEVK